MFGRCRREGSSKDIGPGFDHAGLALDTSNSVTPYTRTGASLVPKPGGLQEARGHWLAILIYGSGVGVLGAFGLICDSSPFRRSFQDLPRSIGSSTFDCRSNSHDFHQHHRTEAFEDPTQRQWHRVANPASEDPTRLQGHRSASPRPQIPRLRQKTLPQRNITTRKERGSSIPGNHTAMSSHGNS